MGIVLLATMKGVTAGSIEAWRHALLAVDPSLDIRGMDGAVPAGDVDAIVLWGAQDLAALRTYPNLRLIVSMGAGVDHLLRPPGPPPGVAVARLKDTRLTQGMVEWVLLNVLRFHRQDPEYRALQAARTWEELPAPETAARRIGILGLGEIGGAAGRALAALGFPVMGWSRSPRHLPGIECLQGAEGLDAMLARADMLVCLLPLTPETRGVINARTLACMPPGGFLINGGRGGHAVQSDVLKALDSGQLAGAALDVFEPEPLPPEHPFWAHPKVFMTPHAASFTIPASAAPQVVDNIRRARAGLRLLNLVDTMRGY
jgi:glyoxylate/hydroxypyruvate reductase A